MKQAVNSVENGMQTSKVVAMPPASSTTWLAHANYTWIPWIHVVVIEGFCAILIYQTDSMVFTMLVVTLLVAISASVLAQWWTWARGVAVEEADFRLQPGGSDFPGTEELPAEAAAKAVPEIKRQVPDEKVFPWHKRDVA